MRSLKLILVLFLVMMIIDDSSSILIMYRKLKPLSGPLNYDTQVRMKYQITAQPTVYMYLICIMHKGNGSK